MAPAPPLSDWERKSSGMLSMRCHAPDDISLEEVWESMTRVMTMGHEDRRQGGWRLFD